MNLKDVLNLKIDSLENAILFLKNFPKCCSVTTEHDERAKYEPWTNRKNIFFTKLGITPYISNPDDKNNKKEYNQWHLETIKLAGELIKDYSVVSFYKAIADADIKWMSEVSWFLKTLEQSLKEKKLIKLTSLWIRKWKRKVRRKAA